MEDLKGGPFPSLPCVPSPPWEGGQSGFGGGASERSRWDPPIPCNEGHSVLVSLGGHPAGPSD